MANAAELRERDFVAECQPHRRGFENPSDPRLERPLGRLRAKGLISESAYLAGVRWREIYLTYLLSIGAPSPYGHDPIELSDEDCEKAADLFKRGFKVLDGLGKRVFHAVNAIAVFEEPEELGDFTFTVAAARRGLDSLARGF